MDSCSVLREKIAGLEVKIRSQCPHLLDIDGDSCHHFYSAAKQFSKPFGMHVESLCTDIDNDLKWSPDLSAVVSEIFCASKKNMPLDNFLLKSASTIDAVCRKHSLSLTLMKGLPVLGTNVISVAERDGYDLETHKYHAASLQQPQQKEPVDNW
ncbi:hypothetical protein AVEN_113349-1 [Araneus ventricosus]|uniref:Uncharacterized protein n=1 Tax=Araneus ventricosus TaxID=182803 RepID=A0A4Y2KND1_ARAVE|nr:hypothetical protein AVEN_113349-1 [Araneus ventricosus]